MREYRPGDICPTHGLAVLVTHVNDGEPCSDYAGTPSPRPVSETPSDLVELWEGACVHGMTHRWASATPRGWTCVYCEAYSDERPDLEAYRAAYLRANNAAALSRPQGSGDAEQIADAYDAEVDRRNVAMLDPDSHHSYIDRDILRSALASPPSPSVRGDVSDETVEWLREVVAKYARILELSGEARSQVEYEAHMHFSRILSALDGQRREEGKL